MNQCMQQRTMSTPGPAQGNFVGSGTPPVDLKSVVRMEHQGRGSWIAGWQLQDFDLSMIFVYVHRLIDTTTKKIAKMAMLQNHLFVQK